MQHIRSVIAFILSWLFVTAYTLLYVTFTVLTLRLFSNRIRHIIARPWGRIPLWLSGITLRTENFELLQEASPRVVIFNHQSTLDVFWLAATYPPRSVAIIKKEFAYIPIINIALWSVDCLFLDRNNKQKSVALLAQIVNRIRAERLSLFVAPEGTRSPNGALLPFKKGPFHVALQGKLPIYPIVAYGAHALLPRGKLLARTGTIHLRCLEPIDTSDWTVQNMHQKIQQVRNSMAAALSELQQNESSF